MQALARYDGLTLTEKGYLDTETVMHRGKWCEDTGSRQQPCAGVMQPQAKGCEGCRHKPEAAPGKDRPRLEPAGGVLPAHTWPSDFWMPNGERTDFCCFKPGGFG